MISEESWAYIVTPVIGKPLTLAEVAVVAPELKRFLDPVPLVPRCSRYAVTLVPAVQAKVALDPVN